MASTQDHAEERKKQAAQVKMRRMLSDAYAALEGQKSIQAFTSFSFEEALDNQIDRISGSSSRIRPNELDRVARIEMGLQEAVKAIKQVPPEAFLEAISGRDVNT